MTASRCKERTLSWLSFNLQNRLFFSPKAVECFGFYLYHTFALVLRGSPVHHPIKPETEGICFRLSTFQEVHLNKLQVEYNRFVAAVLARDGDFKKACLALFAYVTEAPERRKALDDYLDVVLGPVKIPGNVDYKIISSTSGVTKHITIAVKPLMIELLNSFLNGKHPLCAVLLDKQPFDFSTGSNPAWLSVHFDDGVNFVLEIAKAADFIGVEAFATKNGDMVDTTGTPLRRPTVEGDYALFVCDKPGMEKSIPTHMLTVVSGE